MPTSLDDVLLLSHRAVQQALQLFLLLLLSRSSVKQPLELVDKSRMLTYADVCSRRMLTYAVDVC
jgi:hypothetical protein